MTLLAPDVLEDLEWQLKEEPEVPCHINPAYRVNWCVSTDDHAATVALLFNCGHAHHYCETAAPKMLGWVRKGKIECTRCLNHPLDAVWVDLR